jgi:transcriptional regulator with XRE-family HTH domain
MTENGSTVVRRQLGRELRAWRERANRTLDDVAAAQIASVSKVQRIEHGRTSVRPGDVRELCRLYGVHADTAEALVALARATRDPDWWERHDDVSAPSWFALYLRLEAAASELCSFEPALVHGLFQTERYARRIEYLTTLHPDVNLIERYVSIRLERQRRLLRRSQPPRIRLLLGEAALRADVGDPDILAEQQEHLRSRAGDELTSIRVLPVTAPPHPGAFGAFSVLRFTDPEDPAVAYIETYQGARYPETPVQVAAYQRRFDHIWKFALPIEEYSP